MQAAHCLVFLSQVDVCMSHAGSMFAVFVNVSCAIAEVQFSIRHYLAAMFQCYHWAKAMSTQTPFIFHEFSRLPVHQL